MRDTVLIIILRYPLDKLTATVQMLFMPALLASENQFQCRRASRIDITYARRKCEQRV